MTTISKGFVDKVNEDFDILRREYENALKEYNKIRVSNTEGYDELDYSTIVECLLKKIDLLLKRYNK